MLVASDAIMEGENLQDASLLINYDLHWTPLRLIQRIGRIDRPTKAPRHVDVFNFYPGQTRFDDLLGLLKRLTGRSDLYDRMARTRVVGDHERDLAQVDDRDLGLVRSLYEKQDYESLLDQYLPTTHHLVEYARATREEIEAAQALPLGARSCKPCENAGTFALLRHGTETHCAVTWRASGDLKSSPERVAHEALLVHVAAEKDTLAVTEPPGADDALTDLVGRWARERGVDAEHVTVVVAESLAT